MAKDDTRVSPQTAVTVANLARVLQDTKQLDEAEELFRKSLAICSKGGGPFPPTYPVYLQGCIGGVVLLRSADPNPFTRGGASADEGRAAVEGAIATLMAPPYSLPATDKFVNRLIGYRKAGC